jgi:YYY domain-containing protein
VALYAFTAQAIQLSHFFAMDPASTTFTVMAVLGGVIMVQDRSWRGVWIAGIGAGLAISSKFSALPILAVPVVAAGIVLWLERGGQGDGRQALRMTTGALAALFLAGVSFFVTSPYAILDWANFAQATLIEQGAMVRGAADFPFTRQYRDTTPYLYFIEQQIAWGMWWPLGLLALAGTLWAAVKVFALRARPEELVVWAWVVPYFGLTGAFLAKFNRYMSPVLPFAILFGVGLLVALWQWRRSEIRDQGSGIRDGASHPLRDPGLGNGEQESPNLPISQSPNLQSPIPNTQSPLPRILAGMIAAVVLAGSLFWSLAYVNGVYNTEHPWIIASRWVYENAPPGSVILWELWDDPLPKAIPGEPGMDMGSRSLRNIDWSPYEEDTAQKYEILRQKLREADYVIYSSKRIYGSVAVLPERYPMTTRYYDLMFSEQLGFRHAAQIATPPSLFGLTFDDAVADESWSLYDHPQVSIFEKVRDLSDAEFDALLGGTWEGAIPWYRGEPSALEPLLRVMGLSGSQESRGMVSSVIDLLTGRETGHSPQPGPEERADLSLRQPLQEMPLVDDYRWNVAASESPWLGVAWWWLVLSVMGWVAWPISYALFRRLRDGGYLLSKALGWLLAAWVLWLFASFGLAHNTVMNAWLAVGVVAVLSGLALLWVGREMAASARRMWPILLLGEGIFALAYVGFVLIRMGNPDLWQPWFGGEKFMEFAFLNGILRSPTFPPVDPHFAGGYINYYYFGIYLVAYQIKLTGIYAEVAFNLAIPALFALTVVNAFAVAYSAIGDGALHPLRDRGLGTGDWGSGIGDRGSGFGPRTTHHAPRTTESVVTQSPNLPISQSPIPNTQSPAEPAEPQWDFTDYRSWGSGIGERGSGIGDGPRITHHASRTTGSGSGERELETGTPQSPNLPISQSPIPNTPIPNPQSPTAGLGWALLAPLFVVLIGNLDGLAQVVRHLINASRSDFQSAIPGLESLVRAVSGLLRVTSEDLMLPGYNFWDPSRVIPFTINEFPYWSFIFADLHPHMIGIPFSVLFLGLALTLLRSYHVDWRRHWGQGLMLLAGFSLLLGTLASVNLWELPTYFGLGVLALLISQFRGRGYIPWLPVLGMAGAYLAGTYLLFFPFFRDYANVGASGVGLVREPDELGRWLLIWGFFAFVLVSWLLVSVTRPARPGDARPSGLERWLALAWGKLDRLPRLLRLHGLLVTRPSSIYLLGRIFMPLLVALSVLLLLATDHVILALCLPFLGLSFLLLWRRGREGDPGTLFALMLTVTGFALLAGTQVFFLKDFLQGGDFYRMNTLFKFFIQVWVLWGIAAAIAVRQILGDWGSGTRDWGSGTGNSSRATHQSPNLPISQYPIPNTQYPITRALFTATFALLLLASLAYPLWGTPTRMEQRFPGWQPEVGTLNGMDFMNQGVYFWPDGSHAIELRYDRQAIDWLLANVRGNLVIAESSMVEYYRAGGTRVASMTGLSGLSGLHAGEQRYGDIVGQRNGLMNEFWATPDVGRTQELINQLDIALIYVGQLERHQHPMAVIKLAQMANQGQLIPLYENERVIIYAVPGRLIQLTGGGYGPG